MVWIITWRQIDLAAGRTDGELLVAARALRQAAQVGALDARARGCAVAQRRQVLLCGLRAATYLMFLLERVSCACTVEALPSIAGCCCASCVRHYSLAYDDLFCIVCERGACQQTWCLQEGCLHISKGKRGRATLALPCLQG